MTWRAEEGQARWVLIQREEPFFRTNSPAPNKLKCPPSYSQPAVLAEAEVAEAAVKPEKTEVLVGGEATGGGTGPPVRGGPQRWVVVMCSFKPLIQRWHTLQ